MYKPKIDQIREQYSHPDTPKKDDESFSARHRMQRVMKKDPYGMLS